MPIKRASTRKVLIPTAQPAVDTEQPQVTDTVAEVIEDAKPVRKRRTRTSAAAANTEPAPAPEAPAEAVEPAAPAVEPPAEEQQSLELSTPTPAALANASALPALDAPAVTASEPELSYKIDFNNKSSWFVSADGGTTKEDTGTGVIAGMPVDLALQISAAKGRPGFDQRLRLAFYQPVLDGSPVLAEINCNAVNTNSQSGDLYVTSTARSLTGALLAISESEDDIEAFCNGARFRLRPGTGRGVFIEVDIAAGDRWVAMASPANTNRVAKDARGFHHQLALIKSRFRGCGHLLSAAALTGELEAYDAEQRDHDFVEIAVTPVE